MSAAAAQSGGQDSDELNFEFGRYFVSWTRNNGYEKVGVAAAASPCMGSMGRSHCRSPYPAPART